MWRLLCHNLLLPFLLLLNLNFQITFSSPFNSSSPSAKLCSPEQSFALLHFKDSFTIAGSASMFSEDCSYYPKTDSWEKGSDCCSWEGVTCDSFTGQVIGLDLASSGLVGSISDNSSLFLLHHLHKLNLACNDFTLSSMPSKFGQFMKLTHLNLSDSSFYGLLPTEIFHLSELVSIDLSGNFALGLPELSQHVFYKHLQNLTKLCYLHLHGVDMVSVKAGSFANLSSTLTSLDLSDTTLQGKFPEDVFHHPFLERLILSNNYLTGNLPKSNWSSCLRFLDLSLTSFSGKLPDKIGNLKYLSLLNLFGSHNRGSIPTSLWNCTKLTYLDLSFNNFIGQIEVSLSKLSELKSLKLDHNSFSKQFPDVFGNLSKLTHLDVSFNNFSGQLPSSAFNLIQLSFLDFSSNQLEGRIPHQVSGLSLLTHLHVPDNFVNGKVPSWLFTLPSLESLDLSNNKLTGSIEEFHQAVGSLEIIYLGNNKIHGEIPNSMFDLLYLTQLNLSSNNLSGIVKLDMLSKLKNLNEIDLSYNPLLSLITHKPNFTLPNLEVFKFSSCNITEFPIFLGNQENLAYLDLSNNRISGQISQGQLELFHNLSYLNLSYNFLTSFVPSGKISMMNLNILDLHSNLLQGPLMMLDAPNMEILLLSNNKLTGEISSYICNLNSIIIIDLSNNSLSGTIPQCLGNFDSLSFLNVQKNNFHGNIPQAIAISIIQYLNLNGNKLEGSLPPTLINCSHLEVLDVGNNMIKDTFPNWLATLPELQVLILRFNRFHGPIGNPKTRVSFPKLRILDLSHNQFTGFLPKGYFEKFNMMRRDKHEGEFEYMGEAEDVLGSVFIWSSVQYYSIHLTIKGVIREVDRILTIFRMIDLSKNQFQGRIPNVIGKLNSLQLLNFSHNNLIGHIPLILENLTKLESLDLSFNSFVGEIPNQLTSLSFLSMLNLSYNRLVGSIPQGNQFNTFQNDSYIGNFELCGLPLSKKCGDDEPPSPILSIYHERDDDSSWFDWKIALMGYGCGLVIGLSIGYIVFTIRKPLWFVVMVDRVRLRTVTGLKRTHPRKKN